MQACMHIESNNFVKSITREELGKSQTVYTRFAGRGEGNETIAKRHGDSEQCNRHFIMVLSSIYMFPKVLKWI